MSQDSERYVNGNRVIGDYSFNLDIVPRLIAEEMDED